MAGQAHNRPRRRAEQALYDPDLPTPTHAERARTLVEHIEVATLSTIGKDPAGTPYGSFVTFACAGASPVFLISELAEHTKNLRADPRSSLLVAEGGDGDPLARGRVTLLGTCKPLEVSDRAGDDADAARAAYLARHPNAAYYADFKDFRFWRLTVESVRYIGGYGRMSWVTAEDWHAAAPDPLAPHAAGIVAHMNADHADALLACCRAFSRADAATAATMTGVDRYGFEMSVQLEEGLRPVRVAFDTPVATSDEARDAMIRLVARAREHLSI